MRPAIALSALMFAAAAAGAQSMSVNKGQWFVSQDIYYDVSANGEVIDIPSEFSTIDECWSLDEEVLIDESMVEMFEGCVSTGVTPKPYGMDIGLSCNFEGIDVDGSALFSVANSRDAFVAQVNLTSLPGAELDFDSHILMIGHRTGACQAPG